MIDNVSSGTLSLYSHCTLLYCVEVRTVGSWRRIARSFDAMLTNVLADHIAASMRR